MESFYLCIYSVDGTGKYYVSQKRLQNYNINKQLQLFFPKVKFHHLLFDMYKNLLGKYWIKISIQI